MSEIQKIVNYVNKFYYKNNLNFSEKNKKVKDRKLFFLKKKDYLIQRNSIRKKILVKIRKKLEKNLEPKNIFNPKDISKLNHYSFRKLYNKNRNIKFWSKYPKISNKDHKMGMKTWKNKTNYIVFKNPEKICKEIKKIKKIPTIKKITDFYFENNKYKHVYSKVIYSFSGKKFPIDTQVFHNDLDGMKVLKIFIYLNNVSNFNFGPIQFIEDSNIFCEKYKKKLNNWKFRLLNKNKDKTFKNKKIISFLGKVGDCLFLNTANYHRGLMPKNKNRMILILSFICHNELITNNNFKVKKNVKF